MRRRPADPTAAIDQTRALLKELVALTRRHLPDCDEPSYNACPGGETFLLIRANPSQVLPLLLLALVDLARIDDDPRHIIELRADGWTVKHPESCFPRLFECQFNHAQLALASRVGVGVGRFEVRLDGDRLLIGNRVEP